MTRSSMWCLGLLVFVTSCQAWPPISWTVGQVWPKPRFINYKKVTSTIHVSEFEFKVTGESCDILQEAVSRYSDVIQRTGDVAGDAGCDASSDSELSSLLVELSSPCQQWPQADMDETYELHVASNSATLKSDSIWGILRGLESFSQMVTPTEQLGCLVVNQTDVLDYPRFSHRGLLLDTSRHYLPVSVILNIISAMEMNKMNVFHWHIVDDQSFPYQSTTFPSLSEKGAYSKKAVYTQENINNITNYARLRGIRVLPEFDSPGHTLSWGKGTNKLLTACYCNGSFDGKFGTIDPSRQENFKFMASLLKEVKQVFPDEYIHLGGDEVDFRTCWQSSPAIQKFMEEKGFKTYEELEGYYFKELFNIVTNIGAHGLVWQEVFINNIDLPKDVIVHIWDGERIALMEEVTSKGLKAILSQGWYLDNLTLGWKDYYKVDPTEFNGTHAQKALVLGGEACMWGEMVDESNIVPRIWPRASAVAERLWSSENVNDVDAATSRLNEHVCRMKRRGVAAEPANGPGYCPY